MNLVITEPQVPSMEAAIQVARCVRGAQTTIDDGAARTIAGWWAGPGAVGHVLAALSTGCEVDTDDLRADIAATVEPSLHPVDRDALDMLVEWAEVRAESALISK